MLILHYVLLGIAIIAGLVVLIALGSARSIVIPGRSRVWTDPREGAGLDYDDVSFNARDGVHLDGWFVPAVGAAGTRRPAAIIVHGWLWNRLGTRQNNPVNDFPGGKAVLLLPMAEALARAGYHVLMFDLRNFGRSERRGVYTGGWLEARDLLGAVDYLTTRADVDTTRIGVVGFSVGGNILLNALPYTDAIRAGVAVQPADVYGFVTRYNRQMFGPFGSAIHWLTQRLYGLGGGPDLSALHPMYVAPGAGPVPVLYVQGTGDRWGGVEDVKRMIANTPNPVEPIFPETDHRFDGYNWVVQHPTVVLDFLAEHMAEDEAAERAAGD